MQMNGPQKSPCSAIDRKFSACPIPDQRSLLTVCLGLGIAFCLIGITMACNPTDVEAMQSFRESFHKMLGEPSSPYSFATAAVVFYLVPGVIMIAFAFRKPTILQTFLFFFGALMLSIVVVKSLFGSFDSFILFQLLVGLALVYCGCGAKRIRTLATGLGKPL